VADLPERLWRWVRLRSRRAFVVVGALPGTDAVTFVERLRRGDVLPVPVDAEQPEQAELIIIVGRISTQSAVAVAHLRERAPNALIVAIDDVDGAAIYATHAATDIVDVDIVVRGLPPSSASIEALLDAVLAVDQQTSAEVGS